MSVRTGDIVKAVTAVVVCEAAGGIGSLFTIPNLTTWYADLQKPTFNPPNSVFGPAWITLYLLMGLAASLVWHKGLDEPGVKPALVTFLIQLVINVFWTVVFFGMHSPLAGAIAIVMLWLVILLTMVRFFRLSKWGGVLLVPYLGWVTFASALNFAVLVLNR
jgi:benzodiazapine receptor